MTDDERAYWDGRMVQINEKLDDILDKLTAARADTTLSQRISKLEEDLRRQRKPE